MSLATAWSELATIPATTRAAKQVARVRLIRIFVAAWLHSSAEDACGSASYQVPATLLSSSATS